jgi:hypothetical protein
MAFVVKMHLAVPSKVMVQAANGDNLITFIDAHSGYEDNIEVGSDKGVEILDTAPSTPDKCPSAQGGLRSPDYLPRAVSVKGFCINTSGKCTDILKTTLSRPEECVGNT